MGKKKSIIIFIFVLSFMFLVMNLFNRAENERLIEEPAKRVSVLNLATYSKDDPGFSKIVQDFMLKYPNIKIKTNVYNLEFYDNLVKSSISSGIGPDLFELNSIGFLKSYISINSVLKLDEFIPLNDINADIRKYCMISDSIYSTPPLSKKAFVVLANKKICDENGIDILPKSFERFYSYCNSLLEKGIVPISFGSKDLLCLRNLSAQLLFSHNRSNLPSEPSIQYLDSFKNIIQGFKKFFPEKYFNMDYNDAKLTFLEGKTAFFFGVESDYYWFLQRSKEFEVIDFVLYRNDMQKILYDYAQTYAINSSSLNKMESIEFAKYISSKEVRAYYNNINLKCGYSVYPDLSDPNTADKYIANWMYEYRINDLLQFDLFFEELQVELLD